MAVAIDEQLEYLEPLSVGQLLKVYRDLFGEPAASRHKRHLIRSIAWSRQAAEEGGLSERALRRAAQIAETTELKLPRSPSGTRRKTHRPQRRAPLPGTILRRPYKGQTLQVKVLEEGFEYEGRRFRTLSALAKSITGSHWNGYRFFDLPSPRSRKARP